MRLKQPNKYYRPHPRAVIGLICLQCGKDFKTSYKHTKYCSTRCRAANTADKNGWVRSGINIPTGSVGAIGEMTVACDLLKRGYAVFRSVSSCCTCDLIAMKNGKLLRVEVRTGYYNPDTGTRSVPRGDKSKYDVLAVLYPFGIEYEPKEAI